MKVHFTVFLKMKKQQSKATSLYSQQAASGIEQTFDTKYIQFKDELLKNQGYDGLLTQQGVTSLCMYFLHTQQGLKDQYAAVNHSFRQNLQPYYTQLTQHDIQMNRGAIMDK